MSASATLIPARPLRTFSGFSQWKIDDNHPTTATKNTTSVPFPAVPVHSHPVNCHFVLRDARPKFLYPSRAVSGWWGSGLSGYFASRRLSVCLTAATPHAANVRVCARRFHTKSNQKPRRDINKNALPSRIFTERTMCTVRGPVSAASPASQKLCFFFFVLTQRSNELAPRSPNCEREVTRDSNCGRSLNVNHHQQFPRN